MCVAADPDVVGSGMVVVPIFQSDALGSCKSLADLRIGWPVQECLSAPCGSFVLLPTSPKMSRGRGNESSHPCAGRRASVAAFPTSTEVSALDYAFHSSL